MNTDDLVIKLAGGKALDKGDCSGISVVEILNEAEAQGVSRYDFYESLAILGERLFLKLERVMGGDPSEPELRELVGGGVSNFSVTVYGFERYAQAYIHDYASILAGVRECIVDNNQRDSASIAEVLHQKQVVVDHVVESLEQQGLVQTAQFLGSRTINITRVSPELKRLARTGK